MRLRRLLAAMVAALMVASLAGPAMAVTHVFNSTNALNKAMLVPGRVGQAAPYVDLVSADVGTVELKFVNDTVSQAFFEYRIDGVVKTSGTPHPVVSGDFIYSGICVDNRPGPTCTNPAGNTGEPRIETFTATDKVEIRLALGGERDWDFDWTEFDVLPAPATATVQFLKNTQPADASLWGFVLTNGNDKTYQTWTDQPTPFDSGVVTISNPTAIEIDEWAGTGTTLADYSPSVACTDDGVALVPAAGGPYAGPNGPTFYVYFPIQPGHAYVCTFSNNANITALSPAMMWIGLKNSDDVGLKVDLQAVVKVNDVTVSTGELLNVATGSSGFSNAKLNSISFPAFAPVAAGSGDVVSITVNVKNICNVPGSRNSGTARLWFNGANVDTGATRDAGSRFDVTLASSVISSDYFLRSASALSTTAGSPRTFVDIAAGAKCSVYKTFGTWSITLP